MIIYLPILLLSFLQIQLNLGEDIWKLQEKQLASRRFEKHNPKRLLWTVFTQTKLSCAALCVQNRSCSFYAYQKHVCRGYSGSEKLRPSDGMSTILEGHFRRYRHSAAHCDYKALTGAKVTMHVKAYRHFRSYGEALSVCEADGATLVKLDSLEKVKLVKKKFGYFFRSSRFWIGLIDRYGNDTWYWMDGTPIGDFDIWGPEEPDNVNKQGQEQNCAGIHFPKFRGQNEIYDEMCQFEIMAICECKHPRR